MPQVLEAAHELWLPTVALTGGVHDPQPRGFDEPLKDAPPYSGQWVPVGVPLNVGSVDRYLGRLALMSGRRRAIVRGTPSCSAMGAAARWARPDRRGSRSLVP
jgi:hypothetical protein